MSSVLLAGKGPPLRGGIAAFLELLLGSDLARRHDLALLNLTDDSPPAGGQLSAGNLRRTGRDARAMWRAAAGRDIVHLHSALAPGVTLCRAGALAAVARARGARVVVHAHGGRIPLWLTNPWCRALARLALAPASRVVAVSEGTRAALDLALGRDRVQLIDNGVDLERFAAPPRRPRHWPPRVLFVGVITARKGVIDLFEASARLAAGGVEHELWIAGGCPNEGAEAEAEVRAAAPPGTRFLGTQPHEQMPSLYAEADVFCLPSWWEAMPLTVLEAMASGLPVVATDVGDVGRLVAHGTTGLVVPPRSPDRLAEALGTVLADAGLRSAMGRAGRRRVEARYPAAATVGAVDAVYAALPGAGR